MRMLMVTPNPPYPPQSGGSLRAYGILRTLVNAGHSVDLLCFAETPSLVNCAPLTSLCSGITSFPPPRRTARQRLRHLLFSDQPDIVQRMYSPAMETCLLEASQQGYDVIQFEGLEMATYLPVAAAAHPSTKLIYDSFNAEFDLQRKIAAVESGSLTRLPAAIYSSIQARRIRSLEAWLGEHADGFIVVSPEDAALLKSLRGERTLPIVPSGIFVDDYQSEGREPLASKALVFTGKMDYRPNIDGVLWFASEILPHVRAQHPDTHLYIVGQQPTAAVIALQADPTITVTGQVEHVTPYLRGATVYVAPLRMGSGTRLKLLEAMACHCAIVATETAAAGLDATTRSSIHIADSPLDFATRINSLLQDASERNEMGERAYAAVRTSYDWAALAPRLQAVYAQLGLS